MTEYTKGPWEVFIDDTGGEWTGWPLCITAPSVHEDCMVVRTGGQWPYEWDFAISQREAVANACLISAAPDMLEALPDLSHVINWLENGCDVSEAVKELRIYKARIGAAIAKAKGQ